MRYPGEILVCSTFLKDVGLGEGSQVFQRKHVPGPDHGATIQTAQDNNAVIWISEAGHLLYVRYVWVSGIVGFVQDNPQQDHRLGAPSPQPSPIDYSEENRTIQSFSVAMKSGVGALRYRASNATRTRGSRSPT